VFQRRQVGTRNYWRTTSVEINQPLVEKKLLFRFNGMYETRSEYIGAGRAADLRGLRPSSPVRNVGESRAHRSTTSGSRAARDSGPYGADQTEHRGRWRCLTASGDSQRTGCWLGRYNSDPASSAYYPRRATFNYVSNNDNRFSDFEAVNAEMTAKLVRRLERPRELRLNKRAGGAETHRTLGHVSSTVPTSYYPAGATLPISAANY
jgi:hypothetical protein